MILSAFENRLRAGLVYSMPHHTCTLSVYKSVCVLVAAKKGILRDKRDFWSVLQQVEKYSSDAVDITTSVREMPHIRSVAIVTAVACGLLSRVCLNVIDISLWPRQYKHSALIFVCHHERGLSVWSWLRTLELELINC